ncbi:Frizzled-2 [Gryllus bimaculatus]|nr:Frizzled-2 [Gryllus bimaculatus]
MDPCAAVIPCGVHQFYPLVQIGCSSDLRFFLCSVYMPICIESYEAPLPACRSVCQRARNGCEPLMRDYGFAWPERMACERFPLYVERGDQLCMEEGSRAAGDGGAAGGNGGGGGGVGGGGGGGGALEERDFAAVWVALWSALCFASTLVTVTTFLIDPERFRYPERPIAFLSACYLLVALGYLLRAALGHEAVACDGAALRRGAAGPGLCTLVFLLVYYFGMASAVWWVVLALTWFLAAGLKWGNEAIAGYSQYFHLAAWLLPTLQAVAVLVAGAVDGDAVAGVCSVGNQSAAHLRAFVLAPLLACLLAGAAFLLAGFVALFRIRREMRAQGGAGRSKADKLEKLMIRIGVFSVLYAVPAAALAACLLYESAQLDAWAASLACPCAPRARPLYAALMLKYFMALAVGITSGVWIWSGKTLESWKRLWRRLCGAGRGGAAPAGGAGGGARARAPARRFKALRAGPARGPVLPAARAPPRPRGPPPAGGTLLPGARGRGRAPRRSLHSAHTPTARTAHSHASAHKPSQSVTRGAARAPPRHRGRRASAAAPAAALAVPAAAAAAPAPASNECDI